MDAFIELVPARNKKSCAHYITYKKLNQVWIRIDDDVIKKAALSGEFQVNLAFYKNAQTATSVSYNIDFAKIKTHRSRRGVSLSKTSNVSESHPVKKNRKIKKSEKISSKSLVQEDSTVHTEVQDAVPSTSKSDQVLTSNPQLPSSAQSLIQGLSETLTDPKCDQTNQTTEIAENPSLLTTDPTNTQSSTTVIGEIILDNPTANVGSHELQTLTLPSTSTQKNDSSSDATIIDPENTSVEDSSPFKITSVRSLVNDPEEDLSLGKSSLQVITGMSAEDMAPLELNRRLHVNIEKYVNLLKRYQEGNVKVKPIHSQDVRLTKIKEKNIGLKKFQDFYKKKPKPVSEPSGPSEESKQPSDSTPKDKDSDSSSEADDSEKDESYEPDEDQEQLELELSLQAAKPKNKPSKLEGNLSFGHCTNLKYFIYSTLTEW